MLRHDFIAYRNHVYRVVNLCLALAGGSDRAAAPDALEKLAVAAVFHDLGIWTNQVEPFRRADWIDVSRGLRTSACHVPSSRRCSPAWPDAGFHWRLLELTVGRFLKHPRTPLPMVRL
jgi:hypothetical protein